MVSGLSLQTLTEIQKKALSGQALVKPDATKTALYDYYKQNPNAKVSGPLNASTILGVTQKAGSGTALMSPTGEKSALYNSALSNQKATSNIVAKPTPTSPVGNLMPSPVTTMPPPSAMVTGKSPSPTSNVLQPNPVTTMPPPSAMGAGPAAMAAPYTTSNQNYNSNQSIPDYLGMTPGMIQQILAGYNNSGNQYYNPESDPVYNSMMQLATKQADKAGLATMESMNDRGILNSTVTADRVGQIKQGASDAVLGAIPGLANNFDNKQLANQQGMQSLLSSVLGAGQFQQGFAEDNRRFDKNFTLDEAKVSGRYVSPEAQEAIRTILEGKEASARGGLTPEQRAQNNQKANEARRFLASIGMDISGLDTNVGYNDALKNSYYLGRDSLPQQEMDLAKTEVMGRDTSTKAQGLLDIILRGKKASADGGISAAQRASNAAAANDARRQLAAMGFDVSGLAGNIGYDQALKNSANIGAPTLKAVDSAAQRVLDRDRLTLDQDRLTFDKDSFGREINFKEQNALIQASLEDVRNSISAFAAESDADYKQYLKDTGISEQNALKNTQSAIAEILQKRTSQEAIDLFMKAGSNWADNGVDNREVWKSMQERWPELKEAGGGGGRYGNALPS